jgi:hypothetical protein
MIRQAGKSSRIADFAVDQLYSVGEVIVTDHSVFEYPTSNTMNSLKYLCDKIERKFQISDYRMEWSLDFEFHRVKGFSVAYIKRVERPEIKK